jgi:hypothetical protein
MQAGFAKGSAGLLSDSEVDTVRADAIEFLRAKGIGATAAVAAGQPFALEIMAGLLHVCHDKDQALPKILAKGISTGIWEEIPPSGIFEAEDRASRLQAPWTDIRSCFENWSSAEQDEDRVESLLEEEIRKGWVERWQGTWDDARARWGERAICGKLALVKSEGKEDRLIGDSAAPGASGNAKFPERVRHPTVADVEKGIAICQAETEADGEAWCAITIDVSAAHKRL